MLFRSYLASSTDQFRLAGTFSGAAQEQGTITLSKEQQEELQKKRVITSEGNGSLTGHTPVFIERGKANELLGLLSIGSRTNGKGYSGDDLKGLIELGNKIGLALNAVEMGEQLMGRIEKTAS